MSRRAGPLVVIALSSVVVVASITTVVLLRSAPPAPIRVPAGTELQAVGDTRVRSTPIEVRLPYGVLRILAAPESARDGAAYDDAGQAQAVPPEGGGFVDVAAAVTGDPSSDSFAGAPSASIAIVDRGRSYPLRSVGSEIGPAAVSARTVGDDGPVTRVAVDTADGALAGLVLAVTFDGVTQTVDLGTGKVAPGRAAGLYETHPISLSRADRFCGTATYDAGWTPDYRDDRARCFASVATYDWRSPLGWAPSGTRYVEVRYTTDPALALRDHGGGEQRVVSASWAVRLDGRAPLWDSSPDDGGAFASDTADDGVAVFRIATGDRGTHRLRVDERVLVGAPFGRTSNELTQTGWSWTLPLSTGGR